MRFWGRKGRWCHLDKGLMNHVVGVGPSCGNRHLQRVASCALCWLAVSGSSVWGVPRDQNRPGGRDMGGKVSPGVQVISAVPDPRLWKWRQNFESDLRPRMRKQQELRITQKLQPKKLNGQCGQMGAQGGESSGGRGKVDQEGSFGPEEAAVPEMGRCCCGLGTILLLSHQK